MNPFFSIVIPLYNKEDFITKTIHSILNQTFQDFEIIIINDGSTDNSLKKVNLFNDKRIHPFNNKNKGVSSARNYGVSNSKANYIAFLDADDLWYPNHLKNLKSLIEACPDSGLYATAYEKSFFNKKTVKATFNNLNNTHFGLIEDYFDNSTVDAIAWTSAIAIPKKIFNKLNGFDINLRSGQDTELWIRTAINYNIAFSSKISAIKLISNLDNHLSLSDNTNDRLLFLNRFLEEEKTNTSLKKYMDLNRFSIAIDQKIKGDFKAFKTLIKDIDFKNLNSKQKIVIKSPRFLLKILKKTQILLLKNRIYLSAYK